MGALHVGITPDNMQVVQYGRQGCLRGSVGEHRSERREVSVMSCDGRLAFHGSASGTTCMMRFRTIAAMKKLVYVDDQYLPENYRVFPVLAS
jgi:hypothetical protein